MNEGPICEALETRLLRSVTELAPIEAAPFQQVTEAPVVPVVNVYEDDGAATIFPGQPDMLILDYLILNNSDAQPLPPEGPYNENVVSGLVDDMYSVQQPFFLSVPQGWGFSIVNVGQDFWDVSVSANDIGSEIVPGDNRLFRLVTYIETGSEANVGYIQAQGFLISAPTSPVSVVGPIAPVEALWNPADFNGDGVVDREDLLVFEEYFGMAEGAEQWQGDSNGDGKTDQLDYLCLKENLGLVQTLSSNLPEVDTFLYLSLLGLLLLRRPRNNRAYEQTKGGVLDSGDTIPNSGVHGRLDPLVEVADAPEVLPANVYGSRLRRGTGILPVRRRAILAVLLRPESTGKMPVGRMGRMPMPRSHTRSERVAVAVAGVGGCCGERHRRCASE